MLFDSGLHPDIQTDMRGRAGDVMADLFEVEFRPGEEIEARLAALDIAADSIDYIVNSHLHWDHTGGNTLVANAKIIIQKKEWEVGQVPELIEQNLFNPADYNHGHQIQQIDGEHDLFGDGTVVTVPTYGHTPGHQSLKVKLASGDIILAADACYFRQTLMDMHLPNIVFDKVKMLESLKTLRRLQTAGARIFYGHDPEFWQQVPQAPLELT
ncbi:MAG: N-acyl homoserine lactonase family protein [Alphaproteobacteria bacterium]|nr:N-acyl homoserine lactonase family protein [Alphaproteobacteria bacterium]MDP7642416.1 N-acyl homoserine lactonase family protein [Alphaproteobacteria bacterium]